MNQADPTAAELRGQIHAVQLNLDAAVLRRADFLGQRDATTRPGERARLTGELRHIDGQIDGMKTQLGGLNAQLAVKEAKVSPSAAPRADLAPPAGIPTPPAVPFVPLPVLPTQTGVPVAGRSLDRNSMVLGEMITVLVLAPLVFTICWRVIRGGGRRVTQTEMKENAERLRRIEQAVDTIAIETERISENQRFLTALATEKPVAIRGEAQSK